MTPQVAAQVSWKGQDLTLEQRVNKAIKSFEKRPSLDECGRLGRGV